MSVAEEIILDHIWGNLQLVKSFFPAPLKGLPQNVLKSSSQFTAGRTFSRPAAPKREGGIKVML